MLERFEFEDQLQLKEISLSKKYCQVKCWKMENVELKKNLYFNK